MNNEPNRLTLASRKQPVSNMRVVMRTLLALAVTLGIIAIVFLYGQRVFDMVAARQFKPSEQLQSIDTRLTLTGRGNDVFYASAPIIEQQSQFNQSCKTEERTAAILGCYYERKIYLYDIKNKELDGTLEVTAAHEMLHAAYERLNIFERMRVDAMIKKQYITVKDDPNLSEAMSYYRQAEPNDLVNELHSMLGTTVKKLNPELEDYYKQYFTDRSKIVALNEQYNKVFGEIKKQADELQAKIKQLQPEVTATLESYNKARDQLQADIDAFNQKAKNGGFKTQAAFTIERNALIARTDSVNKQRDQINARVNEYNGYIKQLNELSVRVGELNKSINGVPAEAAGSVN